MKCLPLFSVLGIAALAAAGVQEYRLQRLPKVGQEAHYRLNVELDLNGDQATISGLVIEKVVAVTDGAFTIESVQKEGKAKHGALEQTMPDSQVDSAVYLHSGEPWEIKTGNEGGLRGRLARMSAFISPLKPVKVGDSWSHTFAASSLSGAVGAKVDFKIESLSSVGSKPALIVSFAFKETVKTNPAEAKGKIWLDPDTGERLKLESDWKSTPMPGLPGPVDAKVTLTRVN